MGPARHARRAHTVAKRRIQVIETLTDGVSGLFKKNHIELIVGDATLTADGDVKVGEMVLTADKAIVPATGSVKKPLPGLDFCGDDG